MGKPNIISDKRRESARKHARRTWTCSCGKQGRGNGGWSSHRKVCAKRKASDPMPEVQ